MPIFAIFKVVSAFIAITSVYGTYKIIQEATEKPKPKYDPEFMESEDMPDIYEYDCDV